MKKLRILALFLLVAMIAPVAVACDKRPVLNVYNWGEYIADGSDGTPDVLKLFEERYNIRVNYTNYDTNEIMYSKLKSGGASYDIIIPSDYMIAKLIEEDMLEKIDTSRLANYGNIDDRYKGLYYDPENEYSVPYNVGMVGIVYDTTKVSEEDAAKQSWGLLWDAKYKNAGILTMDNPRDAFATAQLYAGMDVNSTNRADWDKAKELLLQQKRDVDPQYVMDEVFPKMEGGNAAAATYYAGDCITMMGENPDLAFYYPIEGTNIFADAMCIPKGAKNYDAALQFIDFMLEPDIAAYNANVTGYASPNTKVLTNPNYDYAEGTDAYEILYNLPEAYTQNPEKMQWYHNLPTDLINYYSDLYLDVKQGR